MRYGIRLIDSIPPATTTSDSPVRIDCARRRHCLQARRTRFVDGVGGNACGKSSPLHHLARGVRAGRCLTRMAHQDFADARAVDAGPLERCPCGRRGEIRRMDGSESSTVATDRGTGGADNHDTPAASRGCITFNGISRSQRLWRKAMNRALSGTNRSQAVAGTASRHSTHWIQIIGYSGSESESACV